VKPKSNLLVTHSFGKHEKTSQKLKALDYAVPFQVKFVMNDDTNLADLLALNLHNFEDEVRGIVDKATKELGMEKVLKELDVTWSQMEFEYESHLRTGIPLLKSSEELIETLEDNQVTIIYSDFCNNVFPLKSI